MNSPLIGLFLRRPKAALLARQVAGFQVAVVHLAEEEPVEAGNNLKFSL